MAEWERIAADKRARLEKTIPAEWKIHSVPESGSYMDVPATSGLLSETELQITGSSATDLVAKLASGELKSVDVTTAFCKRAAIAHQLVRDFLLVSKLPKLKLLCR
jgi:amidase